MEEIVCPVCGSELKAKIVPHQYIDVVYVRCEKCNMRNYIMFARCDREFHGTDKLIEIAKGAFVNARRSVVGKKFVEIEDNIGGGVWVDKEDAE